MTRGWFGLGLLAAMAAVGCAGKAPIDEAPFEVGAGDADGKADAWKNVKSLGTLEMNQNLQASYTKSPRYRAYEFVGPQAVVVDLWVRSKTGDPVAYLLDEQWNVLAKNDDASDSDTSSHITYQIEYNGTYRIVFRDYDLASGKFTVALSQKQATGAAGRAQEAYYATIAIDGGLDAAEVPLSDLPKAAREWSSGGEIGCGTVAWKLKDSRGYTVWASGCSPAEEMWVVDLFSSKGTHLAHGYGGDSGPDVSYWEPTPWDPTIPH